MYGRTLALLSVGLALLARHCVADTANPQRTFQWKFGGNLATDDFAACQDIPIQVVSLSDTNASAIGTPPYTLFAFELGGISSTQIIGSDPTNLTWKVDHYPGAQLMLTIVDSKNDTGGIPSQFYNVVSGPSTDCLKPKPDASTIPALSANVTNDLETCACWGLTVSNGKTPYTIVLSALDSPIITTIPMGIGDDVLTFPNRADPKSQLMASVYDANGNWGVSTQPVTTFGSTDVTCTGLVTNSKTKAEVEQQAKDAAAQLAEEREHHRKTVILGAVLGVILPLLLIGGVGFFFWRRRKLKNDPSRGIWDGQDVNPTAWHAPAPATPGNGGEGHTEMREASSPHLSHSASSKNISMAGYTVPLLGPTPSTSANSDAHFYPPTSSPSGPSFTSGPSSSGDYSSYNFSAASPQLTPAQRKAMEARGERIQSQASGSSQLPPGASPGIAPGGGIASLDDGVRPDIIIQHRDGGSGVVQELPPPYIDRSLGANEGPEGSGSQS